MHELMIGASLARLTDVPFLSSGYNEDRRQVLAKPWFGVRRGDLSQSVCAHRFFVFSNQVFPDRYFSSFSFPFFGAAMNEKIGLVVAWWCSSRSFSACIFNVAPFSGNRISGAKLHAGDNCIIILSLSYYHLIIIFFQYIAPAKRR